MKLLTFNTVHCLPFNRAPALKYKIKSINELYPKCIFYKWKEAVKIKKSIYTEFLIPVKFIVLIIFTSKLSRCMFYACMNLPVSHD